MYLPQCIQKSRLVNTPLPPPNVRCEILTVAFSEKVMYSTCECGKTQRNHESCCTRFPGRAVRVRVSRVDGRCRRFAT